jgi:hypothetical protein
MNASITAYIGFRYPNWMDYARHQCRVQHLEGWECDLMNDIIADLMGKPECKLADLMSRPTRKIVNGQPTTELDKFVLTMIKCNAQSRFASFRKNTVGQKIIGTHGKFVEVASFCELSEASDSIDDSTYNAERAKKLDRMHFRNLKLLKQQGYSCEAIETYIKHYIDGQKVSKRQQSDLLNIQNYLSTND